MITTLGDAPDTRPGRFERRDGLIALHSLPRGVHPLPVIESCRYPHPVQGGTELRVATLTNRAITHDGQRHRPHVEIDLVGTAPVLSLREASGDDRIAAALSAPGPGPGPAQRRAGLHVVTEPWQEPPWFRYKGFRLQAKLILDRVVAATGIVVAAPLFALLAAVVRLSGRGPVLFKQWRIGRHGAPFEVLKFRTMCVDSEERLRADPELWQRYVDNDFKLGLDEDPRVTRIGRFLRRSSLDELPQLINVLQGQMSMVGPRPVVFDELELYGPWRDAYLAVLPGITGRWQIEGRNDIRFPERAELDAAYVNEWSFRYDVKIMLNTVPAVLTNKGVK